MAACSFECLTHSSIVALLIDAGASLRRTSVPLTTSALQTGSRATVAMSTASSACGTPLVRHTGVSGGGGDSAVGGWVTAMAMAVAAAW